MLTDKNDKPFGRSEEYLIFRLVERIGSPKKFIKHFEEFYELSEDNMSHLLAYALIRQEEDQVLAARSF